MKTLRVVLPSIALLLGLAKGAFAQDTMLPAMPESKPEAAPDTTEPRQNAVETPAPSPENVAHSSYSPPGESQRPRDPEDDKPYVPSKPNVYFRFGLGSRIGYVPSSGLDPFSKTDTLGQISLEVSRTLVARGNGSLAIGLDWDVGNREATARGVTSSIVVHRFLVPIEGRYHVFPWLYGFAKVAPGASALAMSVKDTNNPTELTDLRPGFALDASAGASFLLIGHGAADRKHARLWASPELGYGWTTSSRPKLTTDTREDVLGREEGASLGPIAIRGFFFRIGVGLTY